MSDRDHAKNVQDFLACLIENACEAAKYQKDGDNDSLAEVGGSLADAQGEYDAVIDSMSTYEDVGMLTTDAGLVIRLVNGDEYQVTIKRSR